jgi:hypothetical protein
MNVARATILSMLLLAFGAPGAPPAGKPAAAPPVRPAADGAELPAVDTSKTALSRKPAPGPDKTVGTTIVGEQETSLGLYLTPWKDEGPGDLGQPPVLFDESSLPREGAAFRQYVQSFHQMSAYHLK